MTFLNQQPEAEKTFDAPALATLLEEENTFSDVCFCVGESKSMIKAHKNILIARSNYFRAMFASGMKESHDSTIPIGEITEETFREVLHFLYTGQVLIQVENIVALITASHRFQIDDLKRLCYRSFPAVVCDDNVVPLLLLGESFAENVLKELCTNYILEHYQSLVSSGRMAELIATENRSLVLEIMTHLTPPAVANVKKRRKGDEPF